MQQKTCNIIMCCKGHGDGNSPRQRIARYLGKESAYEEVPLENFNYNEILRQAVLDYLRSGGNIQEFISGLFGYSLGNTFYNRVETAFELLRVYGDDWEPINGFTKEMLEQSKKDLGELV